MQYIPSIGLEVHSELSTTSKVFCNCPVSFGGEPNTRCCPVCSSVPGTLPLLNRKAVEYTVKAGLALHCDISKFSKFDRKNYFYLDLPKAYQISQFDLPLCKNGFVEIETDEGKKNIRLERIHLEEDAGKLIHDGLDKYSLVDYNRCGVPLIEIVSKPDMSSAQEAKAFVEKVRLFLLYAGVSDCKMEEGSLRADVNVSVRPAGTETLGTRTEMKNINSISSIFRAINSEIKRQIDILNDGGTITQETRRWDDNRGDSKPLRSKEDAQDYRYFPEPDIIPVEFTDEEIDRIRKTLPRLPDERFVEYTEKMLIPPVEANQILSSKVLSDLFEEAAKVSGNPKTTVNYIIVEILRRLNDLNLAIEEIPFDGQALGALIKMLDNGDITNNNAKKVLTIMFESDISPEIIAKENGFAVMTDITAIESSIKEVLTSNEKAVNEYLEGNEKTFGFLMGQCSKAMAGRANPQTVKEILQKALGKMKK